MTRVIFRVFPEGDVIALFPDIWETSRTILSYQHLGQHGDASPELIDELRVATPEEYKDLKMEIWRLGYTELARAHLASAKAARLREAAKEAREDAADERAEKEY